MTLKYALICFSYRVQIMPVLDITTVIVRDIKTQFMRVIRIGSLFKLLAYENYEIWSHQGWTIIKNVTRRKINFDEQIYRLHNSSNWIYASSNTFLRLKSTLERKKKINKSCEYLNRILFPDVTRIVLDYMGIDIIGINNVSPKTSLYQCSLPNKNDEKLPSNSTTSRYLCDFCGNDITFDIRYRCQICNWDACTYCQSSRNLLLCPNQHQLEIVSAIRAFDIVNLEKNSIRQEHYFINQTTKENPYNLPTETWSRTQALFLLGTQLHHRMYIPRLGTPELLQFDVTRSHEKLKYTEYKYLMKEHFPKKYTLWKFTTNPRNDKITFDPWAIFSPEVNIETTTHYRIIRDHEFAPPMKDRSIVYFDNKNDWLYDIETNNGYFNIGLGQLVAKGN